MYKNFDIALRAFMTQLSKQFNSTRGAGSHSTRIKFVQFVKKV